SRCGGNNQGSPPGKLGRQKNHPPHRHVLKISPDGKQLLEEMAKAGDRQRDPAKRMKPEAAGVRTEVRTDEGTDNLPASNESNVRRPEIPMPWPGVWLTLPPCASGQRKGVSKCLLPATCAHRGGRDNRPPAEPSCCSAVDFYSCQLNISR
ncbi:MAG: hypothetical protein ACYTA5_23605, partial [Planctomycetota bacterium]